MGGNVFKQSGGTVSIERKWVNKTLSDFQNNVLSRVGFDDHARLGSTGKKEISGDLDIAIFSNASDSQERKRIFSEIGKVVGTDSVKLSGSLIVVRYPISNGSGDYVQIDVMVTDSPLDEIEWLMSGTGTGVKGVYRNLLLAYVAKMKTLSSTDDKQYTVSFPGGLVIKQGGKEIFKTSNSQNILDELDILSTPSQVDTFEKLIHALLKQGFDLNGFEEYMSGSFSCKGSPESCEVAKNTLNALLPKNENVKKLISLLVKEMLL
jgi:hypothetical protein